MAGDQPIIIKKIKKFEGGHHGGAWKVAYADFVTAMMAFFLLMWLINTTSPEQKRGIADYFAPASVSPTTSGSGQILGGTQIGQDGAQGRGSSSVVERSAQRADPNRHEDADEKSKSAGETQSEEAAVSAAALASAKSIREDAAFKSAEMSLRQALQDMPELAELSKHVMVDVTPEGLRIQLIDQEGRPMFAPGSAQPEDRTISLLRAVAEIVGRLPNRITISGHTDAGADPSPDYTNWELSSDRANASRRLLESAGLQPDRIYQVSGKAASEPLFADDPYQAGNRRVSIVLLREAPVLPPDHRL